MAFDSIKEHLENFQDESRTYLENTAAYYKLWIFNAAMKSTSMILKFILILFCLIMFLVFISVAAALAIGYYLNSPLYGFLILGGIYLLIMILLVSIKTHIGERSIINKFSEIFFK